MAKFFKKEKGIEISDVSQEELSALLKINVNILITFMKNNEIIDYIIIDERTVNNNRNVIKVQTLLKPTYHYITYDRLFELISESLKIGILSIQIDKKDFLSKEPLILNISNIKKEIVNSCVYIDYDLKKQIYTIVSKPVKNLPNKLYYFELNDSMLIFNEFGPNLIYGKSTGIGDILY